VVTGLNAVGKSVVISDGPVPREGTWASNDRCGSELWLLRRIPVDLKDQNDPIAGHPVEELPPAGGLFVRMFTWQPGAGFDMHRTPTLDFVIIVSGRLELLLDTGTVQLGPGDCVVQRGTSHGWRVMGDEPCTLVGVFVLAKA
jgi:quercetin dioxygenase-like cupin family protein